MAKIHRPHDSPDEREFDRFFESVQAPPKYQPHFENVAWPENWPKYRNACIEPCDLIEGPCVCGATHTIGEFQMVKNVLYRYEKVVARAANQPKLLLEAE